MIYEVMLKQSIVHITKYVFGFVDKCRRTINKGRMLKYVLGKQIEKYIKVISCHQLIFLIG
jgi:hypothetical protein